MSGEDTIHVDRELLEHRPRFGGSSGDLTTTYPTADTPVGPAQRVRIAIPTPSSVMTLGARGLGTSEGKPLGPGGFALRTVENLAAEIHGHTILDTDGFTTIHSDGAARFLSMTDLGLSGREGVYVGTISGDIDLTAGHVSHGDPEFTVAPSMEVPPATDIDTASPRGVVERSRSIWNAIWAGLAVQAGGSGMWGMFASWIDPPGGRSSPSVEPHASRTIQKCMNALAFLRGAVVPAIEAAAAAAAPSYEDTESSESKVNLHGAGGVYVTTPQKASVFGAMGVAVDSPIKAYLRGGLNASVKSPIEAKLYGGMLAAIKSEGVAKVSGRYASMSGEYAEVRGKQAAGLTSEQHTAISSLDVVAIDGTSVAIGGSLAVDASAGDRLELSSRRNVQITGGQRLQAKVERSELTLEADGASLANGAAKVDVSGDNGIRLDPGGGMYLQVDNGNLRVGAVARIRRGEVTLRGRCNLG